MFPIYPLGSTTGFTYDTLSEIRPGRIRTGLAALALAAAGAAAVVMLAPAAQPVRAGAPGEVAVYAAIDDGAAVPHCWRSGDTSSAIGRELRPAPCSAE